MIMVSLKKQTLTLMEMAFRGKTNANVSSKPFSTQERCLLSWCCEILEPTSGTSNLVTHGIYLQKTVGPSMVRNLPRSTFVTSVLLFIDKFFNTVAPDYYVFPYPQSSTSLCGYYWPSWLFLPLINK